MPRLNGSRNGPLCGRPPRARRFYEAVLQLTPVFSDHRLCAFDVAGRSILLLFKRGASSALTTLPGGTIPPHDGSGPLHIALAIPADQLGAWEAHLAQHDVPVEGRTTWPRGGTSIYFRDLDGHLRAGHAGLMAELLGRRPSRRYPFPCAFLGTKIEH